MMPEKKRNLAQARQEQLAQIQKHLEGLTPEDLHTEYETFFLTAEEDSFDLDVLDLYLAQLDKVAPLEDETSTEESLAAFKEKHAVLLEDLETKEPTPKRYRPARFVILAAAVVAIVGLMIAQVSGWNWIGYVARWTNETFGFTTRDHDAVTQWDPEYDELRAVLRENGVPETLVPKYLPDGYEMDLLEIDPNGNWFYAAFRNGDAVINVRISRPRAYNSTQVEKNFSDPELYPMGSIEHFIMTNMDTNEYTASWKNFGYECAICGVGNLSDLEAMIDSLYTETEQ